MGMQREDDEEGAARTMRKRMYMRLYRVQNKCGTAALQAHIDTLEEEVRQLTERGKTTRALSVLSWKEVSRAFQEAIESSSKETRAITSQIQHYREVVRDMKRWVAVNSSPPGRMHGSTASSSNSWRNVTLLGNDAARELGKTWITQQMYHQMDPTFHAFGFPSWDAATADDFEYLRTDMQFLDDFAQVTHCHQFQTDHTIDEICATYRHHLCSVLMVDGFHAIPVRTATEVTATTTLHQLTTSTVEHVHLLCGIFRETDRTVIVVRQIHEDERLNEQAARRQRHRSYWLELRGLPNGRTLKRHIHSMSQGFTAPGVYLSLDEEARSWGMDLGACAADAKEAAFRQFMLSTLIPAMKGTNQLRVDTAIAAADVDATS
ncbi:Aste57867_1911 [Aphanomyces stellatus]|uniref:Aste57867_1911 protein n=1 Tax=Aphanomyces stellatus TaxID=120398 RepID=A0A485K7J9_9STRA|nr:hypothetical protein As57867_001909 [Aphanomyces stellatus]VFT79117.1 Aste57867_1911 [Aphanomyces stellatus]